MTVARHPLARGLQPLARRAAPDAALVARFVQDRDEAAFAELVRRHGPTVLAVCRHATRHTHDADDAFQATFLVLAKKAHALDPARPLGAWLRGVATRAGKKAARRRPTLPLGEVARPESRSDGEAVAAVRAAVAALPPHQRQAVERCELLGRPRGEVAAELGVPPGTLSSRLALARRALAARLRRQGFAPAAVAVPAALLQATASEVPSRRVVELAEAVMRNSWHGWAAALGLAVAAVGAGLAAEPAPAPRPAQAKSDSRRLFLIDHSAGGPAFLWLDPDGGRPLRLTEAEVRAAGADLGKCVSLGLDFIPRVSTLFGTAGPPRPNGEVPLHTRNGLVLLTPSDPPTVRPLAPGGLCACDVAAWSADGRRAVLHDADANSYTVLDTATGQRTPATVPSRHRVWGWSPAGDWLLTRSDDRSGLARLFGGAPSGRLHRVGRDGVAVGLAGGEQAFSPTLSPTGTRVLTWLPAVAHLSGEFAVRVDGPRVGGVLTGDDVRARSGFAVQVTALDGAPPAGTRIAHLDASCMGLAWSPDGRRIAYVEHRRNPDGQSAGGHLWVCDADGGNRREVPLPAGVGPIGLLAWR